MFERLRALLFRPPPAPVVVAPRPPEPEPGHAATEHLDRLLTVETVVDHHGRMAGKFIRLRPHGHHPQQSAHPLHEDVILLEAIHRLLDSMQIGQARVLLVELGGASLAHPVLEELARRKAVLLLAPGRISAEQLTRLAALRQGGLHLALWMPGHWAQELISLADAFAFSFEGRSPVDAADLINSIRQQSARAALIVVDIGWREEYVWCRNIGCHYAAGKLFRGAIWPNEPLDPGFVHLLDILNKVRYEAEPADIAQAMKSDPLLSFRLLAQANSAAQGLSHKVDSIEQAVVVVGRGRLYRWLVLLLYASGKGSPDGAILQEMAQVRAELMMRLGARYLPEEGEGLYLTGLFSLLEPLMQRPLSRILSEVDVPEAVSTALLEHSGPYAPFLALAEAAEQSETPPRELLAACGINPLDFNRCLLDALVSTEAAEQAAVARKPGNTALCE